MVLKVNFYFRSFESMGSLVTLIEICIQDIIPFFGYFVFMEVVFQMLYNQANVISPDRDFSNQVFTRSMYVWQNSLGNTHYPANKGNDAQFYLVFFIWGFQQFFMVIILLNFLIAVISQSYENVMSKKLIKKYLQKAELIIEAY